MANTIGTTNANVIAQRALEILVADYSFLRNAVTDFSSEAAKYNASVFTHRISATTAQDYSQANGYAATATTQTDVQITLNKFKHVSYSVDDQERTSSNINLIERFGITLNSANVPVNGRYAVLNPSFYGALLNDTTVVANPQITGDLVRTAGIGNVAGFNINQYSAVPGNSITLGGFFAQQEALLIATRVPEVPTGVPIPGEISVVTEPRTGLSVQVRENYDVVKGQLQRTYALIYGVKAGEPASLVRINGS